MLFGVQPIIGASRAEALDKQAEHNALVPLEGGLAILSGHPRLSIFRPLPLDTIMAHRTEPKLQRMQTRYRTMTGELLTLRQVAQNHGQSVGLPQNGRHARRTSPTSSRPIFDFVGGDGFMLSPIYCPGAIEEFVDLVVPELQRRERFSPRVFWKDPARAPELLMTKIGGARAPGLFWRIRPFRDFPLDFPLDWLVDRNLPPAPVH